MGLAIANLLVGSLWIGLEIAHNNNSCEWARGYVLWRNVILGTIFILLGIVFFIFSGTGEVLSIRDIVSYIFS